MSTNPVVALLARQSGARLREMQAEISEQIKSLQAQADLVQRALAEKGSTQPANKSAPPPARGGGNKRAVFLEILTIPHHGGWKPAEVREQLVARGVESSSAAIRVMLRRMAERGDVERAPDGGWRLASTNGSRQESLVEAPSVGPGGYEPEGT